MQDRPQLPNLGDSPLSLEDLDAVLAETEGHWAEAVIILRELQAVNENCVNYLRTLNKELG